MLPGHHTEDSEETKGDYKADRAYPGLHRRADGYRLVLKGKRYCVAGPVGASRGMGVVKSLTKGVYALGLTFDCRR